MPAPEYYDDEYLLQRLEQNVERVFKNAAEKQQFENQLRRDFAKSRKLVTLHDDLGSPDTFIVSRKKKKVTNYPALGTWPNPHLGISPTVPNQHTHAFHLHADADLTRKQVDTFFTILGEMIARQEEEDAHD